MNGQSAQSLGLTGREIFDFGDLKNAEARTVKVTATPENGGKPVVFEVRIRIDTPKERDYYRHGGILQYVLRQLAVSGGKGKSKPKKKAKSKTSAKTKTKVKTKTKAKAKTPVKAKTKPPARAKKTARKVARRGK
jgi:hypothetical protein